jgi:hypothetical protein
MIIAERTLRQQGTQSEIGRDLGLGQASVSRDLAAVRKSWEERKNEAIDQLKSEKIAEWELLKKTCWEAYLKSCDPREKTSQKKTSQKLLVEPSPTAGSTQIPGSRSQARSEGVVSIEETPEGDPRFLQILGYAIEQQQAIMGIKPPEQININQTNSVAGLMKQAKQIKRQRELDALN